ncbi:HpcH/HpaI aldolase/citrate lyase family protein [Sphingomonas flavalba]|uniref:HpcH/HpaI aldolase/citrate lyase family protein n=1 Tax=Sphingomonas flavalba TaxID=2559804 RepID=UPI0039E14D30
MDGAHSYWAPDFGDRAGPADGAADILPGRAKAFGEMNQSRSDDDMAPIGPLPAAVWRSLLFVPGDDSRRMTKAAASSADAVIIDLEDGVPPQRKLFARDAIGTAIETLRAGGKAVLVRVRPGWRDLLQDIDAAAVPGVSALMIPKAACPHALKVVAEIIEEFTRERGLAAPGLVPLIESAKGVENAPAIASVPQVIGIALGTEDFSFDVGVAPTPELLDWPCRRMAMAAAAAGISAYAIPYSIAAFRDHAATVAAAARARSYGAHGALCIHPAQVDLVNEAFGFSAAEIADARSVMAAWSEAVRAGHGVTTVNGRMIDAPVAARAARIMALHTRTDM